jgi:DNA anti-recombination protein RmuC
MGFRTLALNERASEIMKEFGKLKKEFENFGSSTEELQKKTDAMLKAVKRACYKRKANEQRQLKIWIK